MNGIAIELADERLHLMPERAVVWPRTSTLVVADLHWGKDDAFRAASIPVPPGTLRHDLRRIDGLLAETAAERLLVLGDLWHSRRGMTESMLAEVAAWREIHAGLLIQLVRGNHDRAAGPSPERARIEVIEEQLFHKPFVFRHSPLPCPDGYVLAGHLHPAVALRGHAERLRLPCFWFGESVGVLPAFGSFTGTAEIVASPGDRIFVVADGEVIEVG
jgi:DNA ligase-associated metallophosphoesterase